MAGRRYSGSSKNWQYPGWRIEQKYSSGVLIGNWSENRLGKFHRGNDFGNSTNREDYHQYSEGCYYPDVSVRRKGLLMNDGISKNQLFTHHGDCYVRGHIISMYDQHFKRKHCSGNRHWDQHRVAWVPEASDHPIQGENTNFGLKEKKEEEWKRIQEIEDCGDFTTLYSLSYRHHPMDPLNKRVATPRHLSAHLHPHNVHKDLHFRENPLIVKPEVVDSKFSEVST